MSSGCRWLMAAIGRVAFIAAGISFLIEWAGARAGLRCRLQRAAVHYHGAGLPFAPHTLAQQNAQIVHHRLEAPARSQSWVC
jgi:hypothetical protein